MSVVAQHEIYAVAAMLLFVFGLAALLAAAHLLRQIIAVNVMSSGVFLLLISISRRDAQEFADPVPQAMVLTGIVVAVSISAFAMVLARRIYRETGASELSKAEQETQPGEERQ
ncbi:multisubunit sodium/proton antiporter, MrpC subunit [Desulfonatronum thiosulfatophilum]|uniref:Multisubunit sodium/proton antiporter, MrpC subunit n=1 Tax=Desulfonatronum thiosulfatophilum TaxID=617002 RepID=A0A1G6DKH7_9BACT|nr:cation:proton antiporter subunit C [Desulfonatronum thiosulfatophilum]SDB45642.1 multisubunit sodium/proton antiporter, MrpC subunit [Desulfonatronum thiosulfatophilum]